MECVYIRIHDITFKDEVDDDYFVKIKWKNLKFKGNVFKNVYKNEDEFYLPINNDLNNEKIYLELYKNENINNDKVAYYEYIFENIKKRKRLYNKINLYKISKTVNMTLSIFIVQDRKEIIYTFVRELFIDMNDEIVKNICNKHADEKKAIIELMDIKKKQLENNTNMLNTNLNPNSNTGLNTNLNTNFNTVLNPNLNTGLNTNLNTNLNNNFNTVLNPNLNNGLNTNLNPNFNNIYNKENTQCGIYGYNLYMKDSGLYPQNNCSYNNQQMQISNRNLENCNRINNHGYIYNGNEMLNNNNYNNRNQINVAANNIHNVNNMQPNPYLDRYVYRMCGNKKKALLIGINYFDTSIKLDNSINDTVKIKDILIKKYGFYDNTQSIIRLIDNDKNPQYIPTKINILSALNWLTYDNKKGDVLFFFFSGHAFQEKDPKNIEENGYNETILPCDYKKEGAITDDELHRYLIQPLHDGVKLIAIMDSYDSGSILDLAYEYKIRKRKWKENKNPFHVICDVSQISLVSKKLKYIKKKKLNIFNKNIIASTGILVNGLLSILNNQMNLTYYELLTRLYYYVANIDKNKKVSFMSSQQFNIDRVFDFDNIILNKNTNLGQIINYKCKQHKKKKKKCLFKKYSIK